MNIAAKIISEHNSQQIVVGTNGNEKMLQLPIKESGYGSAVNGGELLLLALTVCYSNDIYREASKLNIPITRIEVESKGQFGAEGQPGENFQYEVRIVSPAPPETIDHLILITDQVAEVHNTLRKGLRVSLSK
jgi:uncharacterized OsmC-like protein